MFLEFEVVFIISTKYYVIIFFQVLEKVKHLSNTTKESIKRIYRKASSRFTRYYRHKSKMNTKVVQQIYSLRQKITKCKENAATLNDAGTIDDIEKCMSDMKKETFDGCSELIQIAEEYGLSSEVTTQLKYCLSSFEERNESIHCIIEDAIHTEDRLVTFSVLIELINVECVSLVDTFSDILLRQQTSKKKLFRKFRTKIHKWIDIISNPGDAAVNKLSNLISDKVCEMAGRIHIPKFLKDTVNRIGKAFGNGVKYIEKVKCSLDFKTKIVEKTKAKVKENAKRLAGDCFNKVEKIKQYVANVKQKVGEKYEQFIDTLKEVTDIADKITDICSHINQFLDNPEGLIGLGNALGELLKTSLLTAIDKVKDRCLAVFGVLGSIVQLTDELAAQVEETAKLATNIIGGVTSIMLGAVNCLSDLTTVLAPNFLKYALGSAKKTLSCGVKLVGDTTTGIINMGATFIGSTANVINVTAQKSLDVVKAFAENLADCAK